MTALEWWSLAKRLLGVAAFATAAFMARAKDASPLEVTSQFLDPSFQPGLAAIKQASGIIEELPEGKSVEWSPNLKLLIGVKAVDGSKQRIYFVELSTLRALETNRTDLLASQALHTNRFQWSGVAGSSQTNLTLEFTYRLQPLRVRVFDEKARILKQGQAQIPWELMTNSLAHACRICVALQAIQAMPPDKHGEQNRALEELLGGVPDGKVDWTEAMRPIAGGFLTLGGLFSECISTPALGEICDKAQCVVRLPGLWTLVSTALGSKLDLALDPSFTTDVSIVKPAVEGGAGSWFRFPAELKSGKRRLVSVEFIVGPSSGAEVIVAGIRSIRAVHPTRPDRQFIAQVLASGTAKERIGVAD